MCCDVYCEFTKADNGKLWEFTTPSVDDHQLKREDFETEGLLREDAAEVIVEAIVGVIVGVTAGVTVAQKERRARNEIRKFQVKRKSHRRGRGIKVK